MKTIRCQDRLGTNRGKVETKGRFCAGPDGFRQAQIHFTAIENAGWQHYFNMPGNMAMDNPHYVRRRD